MILISKTSKFTCDIKVGIRADNNSSVKQLQNDLEKIDEWSVEWQIPFNLGKCKVMNIGHKNRMSDMNC